MAFIEKIVSFLYFFASLFFFAEPQKTKITKETPINYESYSNEVTRLLINEVEKELGHRCEMTGGSMPDDIESIAVGFAVYERASVDRARQIEVDITERFLKIINSHEKIRPFLREYPFPSSRARINLRFYDKRKMRTQSGDCVCYVFQANGNIFYRCSPDQEKYELVELATEKYEDALEIVKRKQATSF